MKILPPESRPPREPIKRRHRPTPARRWSAYRKCLRWEFGFTCAFCLLHESDLYGGERGEGLGGTGVEHWIPRSQDASRANDYGNCLYACMFCNRSRSARPVTPKEGKRLLDPTRVSWADHFVATEDRLRPRDNDRDARYTHACYELDDPRKIERRKARRELISDRLLLFKDLENELVAILQLADELLRTNPIAFLQHWTSIDRLRKDAQRAKKDLYRYTAVPKDAPKNCRCRERPELSIPVHILRDLLEVPLRTPGGSW